MNGLEPHMRHETAEPTSDQITLYEIGKKYIQSIENDERFPLKFPERFHNATGNQHPVDVIYNHTTIFDCSDLLIAQDVLIIMQNLSLASAPLILNLWADEGESDNPVLLRWYLGHVRHGQIDENFQSEFLKRLSWDGQRIRRNPTMSMARNRLIMGIEYALSLSVNIRESDELHSSLLAESVFTNRLFLVSHFITSQTKRGHRFGVSYRAIWREITQSHSKRGNKSVRVNCENYDKKASSAR